MSKRLLQFILTVTVLAIGSFLTVLLIQLRPAPESSPPQRALREVILLTLQVDHDPVVIPVWGTVQARQEVSLRPEVPGTIVWVSPDFERGRGVDGGTELARIDPSDFEAAVAAAEAELQLAQARLAEEEALAEQAGGDLRRLGLDASHPLALRQPQVAGAQAAVMAARAGVAQAERNLDRTRIRAPFAARIQERSIDLGSTVSAGGTPVAQLIGTANAEVLIPLRPRQWTALGIDPEDIAQLALLELSLRDSRGEGRRSATLESVLPLVDPTTRLRSAVALLPDPFGSTAEGKASLPPGTFVEGTLSGPGAGPRFRLPASALTAGNRLRLFQPSGEDNPSKGTVHEVDIRVLTMETDTVLVQGPLAEGDRVVLTPLHPFSEGMEVRAQAEDRR